MFSLIWIFNSLKCQLSVFSHRGVLWALNWQRLDISHSNLIMVPFAVPAIETFGKNKPNFKNVHQSKLKYSSGSTCRCFRQILSFSGATWDHREKVL